MITLYYCRFETSFNCRFTNRFYIVHPQLWSIVQIVVICSRIKDNRGIAAISDMGRGSVLS